MLYYTKTRKNIMNTTPRFIAKKDIKRGFTLIELLVVIGIIGVLAAIIIAALDPVEQLRKASDTSAKNADTQFIAAASRYYATHNIYPWDTGGITGCTAPAGTKLSALGGCVGNSATTGLIGEGELKSSFLNTPFMQAGNQTQIYVTYDATGNTVKGCFHPQSRAQQGDTNSKYDQAGNVLAGCPAAGNAACYWCAQ